MSDDESADEDHTVDVAAQLSTLLKPINKKMKAMARRMEDAESQLKRLASQQADELRTRKAGYAHATERSKGRAADARAAREARKAEIRTKADEMRSWKKDFMASLDD